MRLSSQSAPFSASSEQSVKVLPGVGAAVDEPLA
jgi:hypothetical protein